MPLGSEDDNLYWCAMVNNNTIDEIYREAFFLFRRYGNGRYNFLMNYRSARIIWPCLHTRVDFAHLHFSIHFIIYFNIEFVWRRFFFSPSSIKENETKRTRISIHFFFQLFNDLFYFCNQAALSGLTNGTNTISYIMNMYFIFCVSTIAGRCNDD